MYCSRPFSQFYVVENGDVHLCCPDWLAMPAGNLLVTSPIEIWTGKVAKNIRQSIVDQSFRYCINCPFLPGPAGCVVVGEPHPPVLDRIDMLTMAYDATCNLACPSCRTAIKGKSKTSSSIQEVLLSSGILKIVNNVCSSGNGDPLASPLFWSLLDVLPEQDCPDLKLVLQTNGLLLTPKTWDKLGDNAHRVSSILLSVDALRDETYRANRGGDLGLLKANLEEIRKRAIPLQMNFVVQANNYNEMVEFVIWADSYGAYRVYFSALDNWGTFAESDYLMRAIHLPSHPEHSLFLNILKNPILQDPKHVTLARLPRP